MMRGVAGPLAEATADLRLSDGRFNADLSTIMSRLRTAVATMEAQAKIDLTATVKVDDTAAKATVQAFQEQASTLSEIIVPVKVDGTEALAQVAAFKEQASAVDQITFQIDAHTAGLQAARDELVSLLLLKDSLSDSRVTIDAVVRDEEAVATAARLQEQLTALGSERVIFTVGSNATEAFASIAELSLELDKLDTRRVDVHVSADGVAKTGAEVAAADAAATHAASDEGGFGRLALRLGFFGVAGVAAIGALGGKIVQVGVESAGALEGTIASFTNILGSAEKAQSLFTELQAFSIPSPFDTQTLATTARQLLAIGDSVDQVVPDIRTLSAVVAELGNSDPSAFSRLTLALGQIGSSAKPLTQDVRQITSALPGFNAEVQLTTGVAEKLGISLDAAGKKIDAGSITGSEAMRILLQRMQEFPGASGAIAAAADTLQGRLSGFKDTIKLNLVDAFTGVSSQVKDALGPLSESVDVALKAIGPQLASSLSGLIPAIGPFIEQIGTALAPAFGGIATGLAGTIQGLTPALSAILPVVGHLAEVFGDLAAAIGPALGTSVRVLSDTVIPVIDTLSSVLEAIPTGALSTLLTGFLAFKGIGAIRGVFDDLAFSMQKASLQADGLTASAKKLEEGGVATGRFGRAAALAGSTVAGAFSGIALASEDMSTRVLGAIGAVSSIVAQLASGNVIGAAFTAGATIVGTLIEKFSDGETAAKNFQTAVETAARSIKEELKLGPGEVPDLGEIVSTKLFSTTFEDTLGTKLRGAIKRAFDITDDETKAALQGTQADFDAFIDQFVAKADESGKIISLPKFVLPDADDQGALVARLTELRKLAVADQQAIKDGQDASTLSAEGLSASLLQATIAMEGNTGAANALKPALSGLGDSFQQVTTILPAGAVELDAMSAAFLDATPSLASFASGLDLTGTALRNAMLDEEVNRVKNAADDVKNTFADLGSALSQSISNQNLQAQLSGLSDSLNEVIGADKFEAAKQRAESINDQIRDQQDRISDLKASLAEAQAKALQDAADLDVRIADARAHGSVTGLAALEAARANVGDDAEKAQRDLDKATRQAADLQQQLAALDLTSPGKLIDIVKSQAAVAGVEFYRFLVDGPTPEARRLYQQNLADVVQSAFTNIQKIDETQGPQAAINLLGSIQSKLHDQLVAGGLSPGTADEIVESMLHPDELTASLTDELNANLEAATKAATLAGHTVDVGVNTESITNALNVLKETLAAQPPIPVKVSFIPPAAPLPVTLSFIPGLGGILDPGSAGGPGGGLVRFEADGGIMQFFRQGGFSQLTRPLASVVRDAPHIAQIAPAGAWRVFAEPETGGEGYVPLAPSKRGRSTEIVRTIADMFGFRLEPKINVNPTIDIFPTVSPVVNLHPSFTVPPLPERAGRDSSVVQRFVQTLASFGQPTLGIPGDVGMYLTLPHAPMTSLLVDRLATIFGGPASQVASHASYGTAQATIRNGWGEADHTSTERVVLASVAAPSVTVILADPKVPEWTTGPSWTSLTDARRWESSVRDGDRSGSPVTLGHIVNVSGGEVVTFPFGQVRVGGTPGPDQITQDFLRGSDRLVPYNVATVERVLSAVFERDGAAFKSHQTVLGGAVSSVVSSLLSAVTTHIVNAASLVKGHFHSGLPNESLAPEAFIASPSVTSVESFVQSLMAASPPPSRPAVTSVAHMTGWTTAFPSPSMLRLVTIDPKIPAWPGISSVTLAPIAAPTVNDVAPSGQPLTVLMDDRSSSATSVVESLQQMLHPTVDLGGFRFLAAPRDAENRKLSIFGAVSPVSVPSIFEHDKRSALPSPFVSQLVVPWPVSREALPPGATGGPAQPASIMSLFAQTAGPSSHLTDRTLIERTMSGLPGWSSFVTDSDHRSISSLFDSKTIVAPYGIPGAPGGFTSIVDRVLSSGGEFPVATREAATSTSIFHPASPPQAAGTFMFHSAGPNVTAVPSQVTALFGTQLPYVAPLLPPNMQVQITPHADLANAVRELTQMLRSGSPHSERLARAESIARHIHVEAGAITLTSDKPRQSARELVDELTRMAY